MWSCTFVSQASDQCQVEHCFYSRACCQKVQLWEDPRHHFRQVRMLFCHLQSIYQVLVLSKYHCHRLEERRSRKGEVIKEWFSGFLGFFCFVFFFTHTRVRVWRGSVVLS